MIQKDKSSKFNTYEFKSATKIKKEYIYDIAFQRYVLNTCGIDTDTNNLILLNRDYTREGNIDVNKLFKIINVTDEVTEILENDLSISKYLNEIVAEYQLERKISSTNCPPCFYREKCLAGIPEDILNIPRGNTGGKIQKIINRGVQSLSNIPSDIKLTDNQKKYVDIQISKKPEINQEFINKTLDKLKFPLYFYDLETADSPIPMYDGTYSYQKIPFQVSVHTLNSKNELIHNEYLHLENSNPILRLLENLSSIIAYDGNVVVWNESFEKSRNNEMSMMYPEYKPLLDSINDRMFDLSIIFKKNYLHPDFKGSYSLKKVLPIFYDKLTYSDLPIAEGQTASFKWLDMVSEKLNINQVNKIRKDLFTYSKLDTEGMVKIYQSLVNFKLS